MDIVTQLQEQLNHTASLFFNFVGTLQRDAPPAAADGNVNVTGVKQEETQQQGGDVAASAAVSAAAADRLKNVQEQAANMAAAVVQAAVVTDELIAALPVVNSSEETQLARIAALQEEFSAVDQELHNEVRVAETRLEEIQDLFRLLADSRVKRALRRSPTPSTVDNG